MDAVVPKKAVRPERFWLIVGRDAGRAGVLVVEGAEGEEILPVFGSEDEALLYLRWEGLGEGWRIRQTAVGELVSMLVRPFVGVGKIALDPLPGVLGRWTAGLTSLRREDFVRHLLGERRAPYYGPGSEATRRAGEGRKQGSDGGEAGPIDGWTARARAPTAPRTSRV